MASLAVVEDLNVLEQGSPGHEARQERLAGQEFALQGRKEALSHRVVITVADRSHRAADAHRLTAFAKEQRGILAAMIRMVNDAFARLAIPDRHLQRAHHQLRTVTS